MSYPKSICVDIDDTISFTLNRDWENAKPNIPLIEKLNKLYDEGWDIWYVTARGNLSCKSRAEAEERYRPGIEKWFKQYNVKYTGLSFQKILASYYIDDKSITPQNFINLDVKELKGGLSGAFIEKRNDRVYKTADNTKDAVAWYRIAEKYFNVPKIDSVIGKTICMDYIENDGNVKIFDAIDILSKMKHIPCVKTDFSTYINRIENHLKNISAINDDEKRYIIVLLKNYKNYFDENQSFSHGDFSIDNMLNKNGKLYLIDPIYIDGLYSSWLLDAGKLAHSLNRYNRTDDYLIFYSFFDDKKSIIKLAELTQWIRIYKYSPEELKQRTILEIRKLLTEI